MQTFRILVLFVVSLSAAIFSDVSAQAIAPESSSSPTANWETLRPENEEFAVLMPKGFSTETAKEPYHKMEINSRTYLSQAPNGPVVAVVSLSGIKSNPAMYTETQRVNSYVDAFKKLFTPKLKKTAPPKLHFVRNKTSMGHVGREYSMAVGDLAGTVHAFATRRRFYALVFLHTKKDEAMQEQFLSSFKLPERIEAPQPPPQTANNPPPPSAVEPVSGTTQNPAQTSSDAVNAEGKADTPAAPGAAGTKRPINGGVLNGKAITLPKPVYPAGSDATGVVTVEVTIDEYGSVSAARAISGPPQLQAAAIEAARQARFSPTFLMGEPVKVRGVITYNFAR
ncbi:MAG TPA: TonB family protein [Pyrinomonadaceae bacterium]|nr:TonB family protein [Pyrinomonadaceae bacterium]